jgi:hypothetical protein
MLFSRCIFYYAAYWINKRLGSNMYPKSGPAAQRRLEKRPSAGDILEYGIKTGAQKCTSTKKCIWLLYILYVCVYVYVRIIVGIVLYVILFAGNSGTTSASPKNYRQVLA